MKTGIEEVPSENVGMLEPILGATAGGVGLGACVTEATGVLGAGFAEVVVLIVVDGLNGASLKGLEVDVSTGDLVSTC